ncbi:MAG: class I SAM-dependent methyltransferase [Sphingobacteriaceae bacterium]
MANYRDYGYENANRCHAHRYLYSPLLTFLKDYPQAKILDLGCGNGALVSWLLEKGFDAYGTDASEKGIRIASEKHPGRFYIQDLSRDHLPDELREISFDVVISTEVIEHLYDPRTFIRFCKQLFRNKSNGCLLISTPYHGYLKNLALSLFNHWDQHLNPLWDGGHIKMWSKKTLIKLLEEEGFQVTAFYGCGRLPYFWKSMMIKAKPLI